ncbi:MAG: V-type ATP synthase subunit I, partial [Gammaproteobacteria bacterium]
MGMRPQEACWFEVLSPRDQLTAALECLAKSGAVELQSHSQPSARMQLPDLSAGLEEYAELHRHYAAWWPRSTPDQAVATAEPAEQLGASLAVLRDWSEEADPIIAELQQSKTRLEDLTLLQDLLAGADAGLPDLGQLAAAGPYLDGRLYLLPPEATLPELPSSVLVQFVETEDKRFLLALGERKRLVDLDDRLTSQRARRLFLPPGLHGDLQQCARDIENQLAELRGVVQQLQDSLARLDERFGLTEALARLRLLEWYVRNVPALPATERFAWVTGWTSDSDGSAIEACLRQGKVKYLLRLAEPPAGVSPPMVLRNPVWVRPFELFANLLGIPAAEEIDPSRILAVIGPLMFGYMFGDVGHGVVLLAAGYLLRDKIPALALLVPGGISSIIFGFAFGSVFGIETLIPALWLHPLAHPLVILATSLIFGVAVVALGLLLDAVQCHWRGEVKEYWVSRLGLAVTYAGLIAAFIQPGLLWAVPIGAAWFIGGAAIAGSGKGSGAAAMEYGETLLQLAVNTISFVRVGAFALAHGGLSAAVIGLADAAGSGIGMIIILILGNALIIALEGLVVSIQTTRLVLFEFFTRFLRVSGRRFKPLTAPEGGEP